MKRTSLLLVGLLLVAPAFAEEEAAAGTKDPKALEILQKVDKTIKSVNAVSYHAKASATGFAVEFAPPAEGKTYMEGWNGQTADRFFSEVTTKSGDSDQEIRLTAGGDGETFFIVDHVTKKGYEDMDPGVMGNTGRSLRGIAMIEFVHDAPYDDELGADTVELLEDQKVAGEPCYQIRVLYSGGRGESIWFFSKNDYLPRRRLRVINDPERGEGTIDLVVSNVEVAPEVDAKLFKMSLPEGYEAIDDFAP